MLQLSTVQPNALDILKKMMLIPELQDFSLVGGTALALYFGHRLSIDLDLFSTTEFKNETIVAPLSKNFTGFTYRNTNNPIGLFGYIDDVKVDFVKHHYHPLIERVQEIDGVRMFSVPDLMAMKIAAIMKRGVKKDFWDIAELLKQYTVEDFIKFYTQKYPSQQLLVSVPFALTYFIDAEESEAPVSLKGQTWNGVKKFIQQKVNDYLK
ncbi:MAG: nucleotidyl transferase AbiEii/AbiGii toxin family protein [Chitinophagaceae bacterium]|nr:nucleotidyl transferase AbiEii/AbiGii toxin family protein [Chitinophagaceae bacterium]